MPTQGNYKNSHEHAFRDTAAYNVAAQVKVKCTFCGCWMKKNEACYQCHRLADGTLVPAKKTVKPRPTAPEGTVPTEERKKSTASDGPRDAGSAPTPTAKPAEKTKKVTAASAKPDNANQHKFREVSSFKVDLKRVKCPQCGCWTTKGQMCTLCKRVTV